MMDFIAGKSCIRLGLWSALLEMALQWCVTKKPLVTLCSIFGAASHKALLKCTIVQQ